MLAITREAEFIAPMARQRSRYERRAGFAVEKFAKDLGASKAPRVLSMTPYEIREALQNAKPSSYAAAVRVVYSAYADSRGKLLYGDGTPKYVLALERLAKVFPEARFIHLIRDGRDVALSYMGFANGPNTIPEAAAHWSRLVNAGQVAGKRLGDTRYCEVRFENLVKDPPLELSALCSFLGITFSPHMLEYHRRPRSELAINPNKAVDRPPMQGTRNWREEMSPRDQSRFEAIAGDLLERLHYERSVQVNQMSSSAARLAIGGKIMTLRIRALAKRLTRGSRKRIEQ